MNIKASYIIIFFIMLNNIEQSYQSNSCPNVKSSDIVLSRRKRALKFPEGSNFVVTNSIVKTLLVGLPLGWNALTEMDVIFKSPGLHDLILYKFNRKRLHNRQKRDLFKGIETALNEYGINGKYCLLRSICEVKYYLRPENEIFFDDILKIILKVSETDSTNEQYIKASEETDCEKYGGGAKCPISLLQALLYMERKI